MVRPAPLTWLADWIHRRRDSAEVSAVVIETLDNPGWSLDVVLADTEGHPRPSGPVIRNRVGDGIDWSVYRINGNSFSAGAGTRLLGETVSILAQCVDHAALAEEHDALFRLSSWFSEMCNEDWEHDSRVRINSRPDMGWDMRVNLVDTYSFVPTVPTAGHRSGDGWLTHAISEATFKGSGGLYDLGELIDTFLSAVAEMA